MRIRGYVVPLNWFIAQLTILSVAFVVTGCNAGTKEHPTSPTVTSTFVATPIPPTEPPIEASLQDRTKAWLLTLDGVSSVSTFDVDIPGDEPPLIYVELTVEDTYNNTLLPFKLLERLNGELQTTKYSDFEVLITDPQQIIGYTLNSENTDWDVQTLKAAPEADHDN